MEYEIGAGESVSQAVLRCVSQFEDTAITELPLLYESVDPDALNRIFTMQCNSRVSFAFSNSLIDVYNNEYLTVEAA
ncbi:HalOD1 output domain-containing protein [Halobaculum roseum]|uniref:HalOD1 output domain-containing protein n=1 Tax=Halobaculum roseum TaxID=2175149 RepID=A0ABD5MMP4_9EURY|nr:hypothetical protein K6T36_11225 [Halobaculum roseum]